MESNTKASHDPAELGGLERSILLIVWRLGSLTAEQVREELERPLKDATVRTVLRRLEEKGYLAHSVEDRAFVYRPAESRQRVAGRAAKRIVDWFCDGSVEALLVGMVDSKVLDHAELQRLAERIAVAKKDARTAKKGGSMILVLIEAAFRSLFVGLIVAICLRVFRVRDVFAQKAALGLVLMGALAMPLLMPIAKRVHLLPANASIVLPARPMTLLEELQARIQAKSGSGSIPRYSGAPISAANPPQADVASNPLPDSTVTTGSREARLSIAQPAPAPAKAVAASAQAGERQPLGQLDGVVLSTSTLAFTIYFAVGAVLLLRLFFGLALTLRLWLTSTPIPTHQLSGIDARLCLRTSTRISSPLTIGSAIVLPADYVTWDKEKLRIVLAHERSHVRQGDFYLQLIAGLYAVLVWFSPLGWWLKRRLADLAEAISDRAGIEEARSRTSYAQVLLEFAAAPRPNALGVPMARSSNLARRIERLLNDHTFRQSFAGGPRTLGAVVLVPIAIFAATALVRVQAASQSTPAASVALAVRSAASTPTVGPAVANEERGQLVAKTTALNNLGVTTTVFASADATVSPEVETAAIAAPEIATAQPATASLRVTAIAPAMAVQTGSSSSRSFDRTLSASGETQLMVATGSGDIRLTRSSGNQIHIHGEIHVSHEGSEEQARAIAANPPIEQTGNAIRVGQHREEHWRGISIDYQIEAPAGTQLDATSGSGEIVDEGVGKNAKLQTGSGDIRANGLDGAFIVQTGSGDITAELTGQGDVKAQTGSGNIEIKNIHGDFKAQTGSGDIKATGTPSAPWNLVTGSGDIEIWSGDAPITIDGSTGSGTVISDHEMLVKGSLKRNHITGNLNGGGPLVHLRTGSGDIHLH
jgi:predicted transcriptional regulator